MSIDSDIEYYRRKVREIENATPKIKEAIADYENALNELERIKGVAKCKALKIDIENKIISLNSLITDMQSKKRSYKNKISSLLAQKEAMKKEVCK